MQPKDLSMFTKFPAMHQSVFVGCLTVNTVLYTLRIEYSQCVQNPDAFSVLMANSRQVYLPPKLVPPEGKQLQSDQCLENDLIGTVHA